MKRKNVIIVIIAAVLSSLINVTHSYADATSVVRWVPAESSGYAWWIDNRLANDPGNYNKFQIYYTPKVKLYDLIAANGSTVKLKWQITNPNGDALKNTPVTLVINPAYTYPTATLSTPSINPKKNYPSNTDRDPSKADNANINLTTDENGYVTYEITNNTSDADAEPLISNDGVSLPPAGSTTFTQLQMFVGTFTQGNDGYQVRKTVQTSQDIDILEIHWQLGAKKGAQVEASKDKPAANTIRWSEKSSSGVLWSYRNKDAIQSILKGEYFTPKVDFFDVFAKFGTSVKLSWHVTDPAGKSLINTPVTLILNPAYSAGTANVINMEGKVIPLAYSGAQDGMNIPLTTDENGNVFYTIKNNDLESSAETAPFDKLSPPTGSVYLQAILFTGTYPNFASRNPSWSVQKIQDIDILEIHFVNGLPVATTGTNGSQSVGGIQPSGGVQASGPIDTSDKVDTPIGIGTGKAPKVSVNPSLTSNGKVGNSVKLNLGKWISTGNTATTINWFKCQKSGKVTSKTPADCELILTNSGTQISLSKSYVGYFVRASVTKRNPSGSTTAFTASLGPIK